MNDSAGLTQTRTETSPETRSATHDHTALDRAIRSGLVWTGAAKWAVQIASWASTLLVVHLLAPRDYGILGMALVFVSALQPLCDFGIAAAVVRDRTLTTGQIEQLNGLALVLGIAGSLAALGAAVPIAEFFNEQLLGDVVRVFGLTFIVAALRVVPGALLTREMRFRALAAIETTEALCTLVVTLGLAIAGYGYWSLVFGNLAGRAVGSIMSIAMAPVRLARPTPALPIARSVRFGAWVAMSTLAWYAYTNADRVVVGRLMGEAALGAYAIGMTLAALPIEKLGQLYQRVAESVLAKIQDDRETVVRYLLGITESVAAITFPTSIGLALVADQFVYVILGEQWRPAIVPLRLLAAASAARSLDPLLAQVLIVTGHAHENARSMGIAMVVLPVAFLLVAFAGWGPAGVAAIWLVGHPAVVLARQLRVVLKLTGARFATYMRALLPATSSTVLMSLAVLAAREATSALEAPTALAVTVASGSAVYIAALLGFHRRRVNAAWAFARGRGPAAP